MATPRSTRTTPLDVRAPRTLGALLVVVLALLALAIPGAQADPQPTASQARAELARLEAEVDNAVEEYNEARVELRKAQRHAAAIQARVGRAEQRLTALQRQMGSFASAAYQTGGMDSFVTLMTSSPQTFLDRASTMDRIAQDQAGQFRALKGAANELREQRLDAAAAVEATRVIERRMAAVRRTIEAKAERQQRLLDLVESRAARLARAARESRYASSRASRAVRTYYNGPASGRAKIAVAEAYRQLGKPYQWGAEGPDRFDCSGLTMWVWGKAGVSLPHSSRMQIGYGRRVSKSELQPGDLVFYGSPIHHVGIYVGGGQYIAAPHTGAVVGFRDVNRGDWAGATRL